MITKALTEAEKKITQILTKRETETNDIKKQIEETAEAINKLSEEMEKAKQSGEVERYKEFLRKFRDNQDIKEMYSERLHELEEKPLITKEQYEAIVSDIKAKFSIKEDEANEKLYMLSEEMKKISEEMTEISSRSNKVLQKLQHDVYRDADRTRSIYGHIVDMPISVKNTGAIFWGKAASNTYPYEEYVKNKGGK